MGVPLADGAAPVVAALELVGGLALVLGLLTRIFAALLIMDMIGAPFISNDFFVANNGFELVLLFASACLVFVLTRSGRHSVDNKLLGGRLKDQQPRPSTSGTRRRGDIPPGRHRPKHIGKYWRRIHGVPAK